MLVRGEIQRTIRVAIALASMMGFTFFAACAGETPRPTPIPAVEMPSPTAAIESPIESAQRATVMIIGLDEAGEPYALASGSIIDPRGLVLTNFHVIGNLETGELYNNAGIAWVGLSPQADVPPGPWYTATVVGRDVDLDLAVLEIAADVDGKPLTETLNLPTVPIGDPDSLHLGDTMSIFGYPATGFLSSPEEVTVFITLTQGIVSGFLTDEDGVRVWIKTDAEMSGGNSGGLAINANGELIGIPTQESPDRWGSGGLGLIRPVNLARSLIALAQQFEPIPTDALTIARTPTSEPTATPPPSNTQSPTPAPTPGPRLFEVKGLGFYKTPAGSLWCLGEVENTSGRALERALVEVSLQDEEDKVLATESAFVALAIVPQGGKVPFAILFANPPVSFAKYKALPLSGEAATYLGDLYWDLTIIEQRGESEGYYFTVDGLVQNTGQADAETVTVLVTAYDAHGQVTGFRQADLENALAAGESSPFRVNLLPFGGTMVTYSVQVQGTRIE